MDNRDLFQFPFVNHYNEKDKLIAFLESESENVLWLSGERGIGKTFLIEQIEKLQNNFKIIFLPCKPKTEQTCLYRLLLLLENNAVTTMKNFIENNYDHLLNIGKKIVLQALKSNGLDLESLVNITFDGSKTFINNDKKEQSSQKVIINYIKDMSEKQKLLIILDDFSFCDEKSTDYIIEIILQLLNDPNIKFIISTTPEELEQRQDIQITLLEKLPLTLLNVENFKEEVFFYEILFNIFALDEADKAIVTELFIKCKGKPNILKKVLRDLYCKHGITFLDDHKKAVWKKDIMNEILRKSIDKTNFSTAEQLVLQSIILFNQTLPYAILYNVVMYLAETILHSQDLLKNSILQSFDNFIVTGILQINENGRVIITQNDIIEEFQKEARESATKSIFSGKVYFFLNNNKETIFQSNITLEEWNALNAYHSYRANVPEWEAINFSYAMTLYEKKYFKEASLVLERISFSNHLYSLHDYMVIVNCYFESGNYKAAKDIISIVFISDEDPIELKIEYHMICSKVFNMILEKEKAIEELEKIFPLVEKNGDIYLEILNRKQEILVDTNNGKEKAKTIFDCFITFHKNGMRSLVIGKALKDSIDFYHANMALNYINIAENIFIQNNHTLGLGFLYTNRGFEHFRQDDINAAQLDFQSSIELLKDIRFYEISYPLSNMAACYMYRGNYERAISYITQAYLHNKSNYVDAVLKTQLMMCYCMQKRFDDAKSLAKNLIKYIQNYHILDSTMLRKIYINIGILYSMAGNDEDAYQYVSENYSYTLHTSTWYRAYLIMVKKDPTLQDPLSHCIETEIAYWSKTPFEPWLVTFSHE